MGHLVMEDILQDMDCLEVDHLEVDHQEESYTVVRLINLWQNQLYHTSFSGSVYAIYS